MWTIFAPGDRSRDMARAQLLFTISDMWSNSVIHNSWAFSVAGPRVWNCLPLQVTSAPSLTTFLTRLKTFLFT